MVHRMNPEPNDWIERDLACLWHPYTQMKDCEALAPILIERAEGLCLYDDRGRMYYDTISSWWCNVHGHNHPMIREAIQRQLKTLDHVLFAGFTHRPAIELAERLAAIAPEALTRVFYSDNGSTAVEAALKMSLQYWRNVGRPERCRFVGLDRGYHGDTVGAMSVAGPGAFNEAFAPMLFEAFKVPTPYCYRCPAGRCRDRCDVECVASLASLLERHAGEIAAVILEPLLMGAAGMIVYPAEYLRRAAALCARHGVHLILDEVATGFGRTGTMFACEQAGVTPDFLCLSKGLTGGTLPFAATLTTEAVYRSFYDDDRSKTLYHGHTYTANPVGCAAALASLDIFEREGTLDRVRDLVPEFHRRMADFKDIDRVGDVRCIGLVGAVELVRDRRTREPLDPGLRTGWHLFRRALDKGLLLRPLGDVVYLYLPLCVRRDELDEILDRTYEVLRSGLK